MSKTPSRSIGASVSVRRKNSVPFQVAQRLLGRTLADRVQPRQFPVLERVEPFVEADGGGYFLPRRVKRGGEVPIGADRPTKI
jgi:hypothetical protein